MVLAILITVTKIVAFFANLTNFQAQKNGVSPVFMQNMPEWRNW